MSLDVLSKSVLLIDDDPLIREGIGRNLAARGFDVRTAVDGLDAIQASQTEMFDFVLLDVEMPEKSGAEVLRLLRSAPRTARTRVYLLAEAGDSAALDATMHEGADGVFRKDEMSPRDIALEVAVLLGGGGDVDLTSTRSSAPRAVTSVPSAVDEVARRFRNPNESPTKRPARVTLQPSGGAPVWARRPPPRARDAIDAFEEKEKIKTRTRSETDGASRRRFAPRPAATSDGRLTLTGDSVPILTEEVDAALEHVARGLSSEAQLMETGEIRLSQTGEIRLKAPPPKAPGREFGNPEDDVYAGVINPLLGGVARLAETLGLPSNLTCPRCHVQILLQLKIADAAARTVHGCFACPSCGSE